MHDPQDRRDLIQAFRILENPGFVARAMNAIGMPFDWLMSRLPESLTRPVQDAVTASLHRALELAISTLDQGKAGRRQPSNRLHKLAAAATGGFSGFFGLPALAVELPITTSVMLRSIADIARSQGEDLRQVPARLACLEVFALGGSPVSEDSSDSGYYMTRIALARNIQEAAAYIARRGLAEEGAPALVRLIAAIARGFGSTVSEKAAAQAVPVLGAALGATINALFMDYYQDMARGHFIVRRLERKYGAEDIRESYMVLVRKVEGGALPEAIRRPEPPTRKARRRRA
jgi:hypothetical protein